MRTSVRWIGSGILTVLATACMVGDEGSIDDADDGLDPALALRFDTPGLKEGDFVLEDGLGVVIPPPGQRVDLIVEREDGVEELSVANDEVGAILVIRRRIGDDASIEDDTGIKAASWAECADAAYNIGNGERWTKSYKWYLYASSTPAELSVSTAESALRAALVNITGSQNNCGAADLVSAQSTYGGRSSNWPNVGGTTTDAWCATNDMTNSVGFGTLPGMLAATCRWTSGTSIVSSDVKFNKYHYDWAGSGVPSGCTSTYVLESVATHEFGHVFGMNHVSEEYHGNLTMSPSMGACTRAETTLGLGDIRGLRALY